MIRTIEAPKTSLLSRQLLSLKIDQDYLNQSILEQECEQRNNWFFWRLAGPAQAAFYGDGGIQGQLLAILRRNKNLFTAPDLFDIEACMCGVSRNKILPTVVLIADDLDQRRIAYRLVKRRVRDAIFCLMHMPPPKPFITYATTSGLNTNECEVWISRKDLFKAPGTRIILQNRPIGDQANRASQAMLGGVIQVGQDLFGLTVSHAFLNDSKVSKYAVNDMNDLRVHPEDAEALEEWTEDDEAEFLEAEIKFSDATTRAPDQPPPIISEPKNLYNDTSSFQDASVKVADRVYTNDEGLDWAAILLQAPFLHQIGSWNSISGNRQKAHLREWTSASVPEDIVAIHQGNAIRGRMSPYSTLTKVGSMTTFNRMYKAKFDADLEIGSSGCWIASATTNEWIGVLIGGFDNSDIAYILPSIDILEDIRATFNDKDVSLPDGIASNDLVSKTSNLWAISSNPTDSIITRRQQPLPSSTVPFVRDTDYIERGDILDQVEAKLGIPGNRVALVGVGGIGKSQLAIEYSYRLRARSPETWVFWVHASSASRFELGYREIADRIELFGHTDARSVLRLVNAWLRDESNGPWLIILDNADDWQVYFPHQKDTRSVRNGTTDSFDDTSLAYYIPQSQHGQILVTSRDRQAAYMLTGTFENVISIEPMATDEGVNLFKKKLGDKVDESGMMELVEALDRLPLAMTQAAAHIRRRAPHSSISDYLNILQGARKSQIACLSRSIGDIRRDPLALNSIIETLQISFDAISAERHSAIDLLSMISLLDRHAIPEQLILCMKREKIMTERKLDENFGESNEQELENDIDLLRRFSLVQPSQDGDSFHLHRLVQISILAWLEERGQLEEWRDICSQAMLQLFPTAEYANWPKCDILAPHVESLLHQRPNSLHGLQQWSEFVGKAALYKCQTGSYLAAEEMARKALAARQELFGQEHLATLTSMNTLGIVLHQQGRYKMADSMVRQALDGMVQVIGPNHPDTLNCMGGLALILQDQGHYQEAYAMNTHVLEGLERQLGSEDPETLISMSNLASVLLLQGKYKEAEEVSRRTLKSRERCLGSEHPDTLISMSNLASVLLLQGKYEETEEISRRTLKSRERYLGSNHPDTLISMSNLASVLQHLGEYEEAEEIIRRTLESRERYLGSEHPDTLISMSNLASVLQHLGKYEEAEEVSRRTKEGRERVLGPIHPDTLMSMNNLALMLLHLGKYEAAEKMIMEALKGMELELGPTHPNTLASMNNLAFILWHQDKDEAADAMSRRTLEGQDGKSGLMHPDTLNTVENLALVLRSQRKYHDLVKLKDVSSAMKIDHTGSEFDF